MSSAFFCFSRVLVWSTDFWVFADNISSFLFACCHCLLSSLSTTTICFSVSWALGESWRIHLSRISLADARAFHRCVCGCSYLFIYFSLFCYHSTSAFTTTIVLASRTVSVITGHIAYFKRFVHGQSSISLCSKSCWLAVNHTGGQHFILISRSPSGLCYVTRML